MKHKNKIIAIVMILLIVITIQAPDASAQFGAIGKVFDAFGKLVDKVATGVDDLATGRIDAGETIGRLVGGTVTGVLTGTCRGLEGSIESILRGTEFDLAYRNARNSMRVRIDEKYKLESLIKEMSDLDEDYNKLQQEIVQAGCTEAGNVSSPGACRTVGQTCGPNLQCCAGLTCTNGVCISSGGGGKPNGADCTGGAECRSGWCNPATKKCEKKETCPDTALRAKLNKALEEYETASAGFWTGDTSPKDLKKKKEAANKVIKEVNDVCKTNKKLIK